jgi:hypothetical protein
LIQGASGEGFNLKQFAIINGVGPYLHKEQRIGRDEWRTHDYQQQDQGTPACFTCFRSALV